MKNAIWDAEAIERLHEFGDKYRPNEYFSNMIGDKIVKYTKKWVKLKEKAEILDYGCGPGFLINYLLQNGYKVSGMDFTHESVNIANDKHSGKKGFEGAYYFEDILKSGKTYDVIYVIEVIEHLSDEYLMDMFDKLKRLLNVGGVIIFTTPNDQDLIKDSVYCPFCDTLFSPVQHVRSWNKESVGNVLSTAGFSINCIEEVNFSEMYLPFSEKIILGLKKINRKIRKIDVKKTNLVVVCSYK